MKLAIAIILYTYLAINLTGTLSGLIDRAYCSYCAKSCGSPPTRIGYIFPGYTLGCWLGGTP